jgi:adenosylcobinamide-GDP ribazoletransferase
MIRPVRRFLSVFTLVSRIPVRSAFESDFSRADFWLPLVGIPASLCSLAGWLLAELLFRDHLVSALAAMGLQYGAFNLFHLDGLLDSADAMAGHLPPERRLEILKDSRIGSYAFFLGFLALAAKVAAIAALGALGPIPLVAALLAAPVGGRAGGALVPLLSKPARPGGLGALMRGFSPARLAAGWLLGSLSLVAGWAALGGATLGGAAGGGPRDWNAWALAAGASLLGALAGGASMARLYTRRVGGFTGDAMGAAVELGELACLLAFLACARLVLSG